ncbi:exonuclease domain-containing protein [Sanguibacter antarcticus]|uniref:DNA polymerase-3 subunit epsilon n=1 Tax=Sanguibacter antarcticus TaxID=372484 RepID=A0A2A9E6K5_9MICO|nr:exonuclease domain-containing protein [Sanguibacter antarcticus]PFG33839.1 DNA polymerase-3 subunit epsilon [Sanguibacter antarcticus]
MDFVAIDWETASAFRGSPCAVGVVTVRSGVVVEAWGSLMRPPGAHVHFDEANTAVHGLREEDVASASSFEEVWPEVARRLVGLPVVAHNARFDIGVIQSATWTAGLRSPQMTFGCTLVLSRQHYDLPSYTLDAVVEAAGAVLDNHHEAVADAMAAAQVLLRVGEDLGMDSVQDVFAAYEIELGRSGGPDPRPCRVERQRGTASRAPEPEGATLW